MSPIPLPRDRVERVRQPGVGSWCLAFVLGAAAVLGPWCHHAVTEVAPVVAPGETGEDVRGCVVGKGGLPIGEARVVVWLENDGEVLRLGRATTDASGRFAVSGLVGQQSSPESGRANWWISVLVPGWVSGEHQRVDPAGGVLAIELAPETASRVLFGRVLRGAGDSLGASRSRVVVLDGRGNSVARTSTDAEGRFVLRGPVLARNDLRILAHHSEHGLSRFVAAPEVRRGATARLELTLERVLATVQGVVRADSGAPLVGRELLLRKVPPRVSSGDAGPWSHAGGPFPEIPVRSGSDGSILVRGLEPGDYELHLADAPDHWTRVSTGSSGRTWRLSTTDP